MRNKKFFIFNVILSIIIIGGIAVLGYWFAKTIWDSDLPEWLKVILITR